MNVHLSRHDYVLGYIVFLLVLLAALGVPDWALR